VGEGERKKRGVRGGKEFRGRTRRLGSQDRKEGRGRRKEEI